LSTTLSLWNRWCEAQNILADSVPLFDCDGSSRVRTRQIGSSNPRPVLCRHPEMDALMLRQTALLVEDWKSKQNQYDGIIYMMFAPQTNGEILPLYIGKAETLGKGDGNLSANLIRIEKDRSKFARWGDNYQYHIGDLSAAALVGHPVDKVSPKYSRWAADLFDEIPSENPRLRADVRFWVKAWKTTDIGIWSEMSPTRLTFLEYLLIGVASSLFGDRLLNAEGRNR
jgi:hypothetical protein